MSRKREQSLSPQKQSIAKEQLIEEQNDVMKACLSGVNEFFTGSAGTGTSYVIVGIFMYTYVYLNIYYLGV